MFISSRKQRLGALRGEQIAMQARRASKIRTKASSHSFRKSSATQMLKNWAPFLTVQKILGHKSRETTEVFTKTYPKGLIKMLRTYHPMEKVKADKFPKLFLSCE
jgi:integrase/recombinase XerD